MNTAESSELRRVFDHAAALPSRERRDYLDGACAGNSALRTEVESLLQAHTAAGSFLQHPEVAPADLGLGEALKPGTRIDSYTLVKAIGQGGAGTVYLAQQDPPLQRPVAVKVIKAGLETPQLLARFDQERQALALMHHPNIAAVYDAGTTASGRPFVVMEWVDGLPITEFCRQQKLPLEERLGLFTQVCLAIEHAHSRGIVHRDLKPWNVLVAMRDGQCVAKVIDFGIAKNLGPEYIHVNGVHTQQGQLLGTPQYMSPEQAGVNRVDARSDVYALGVILYELISGAPPLDRQQLDGASLAEFQRILHEVEPPPPSRRIAPGEGGHAAPPGHARSARQAELLSGLDGIVMKALQKNPADRYPTAGALAADIARLLAPEITPRTSRKAPLALALLLLLTIALALTNFGGTAERMTRKPAPAPTTIAVAGNNAPKTVNPATAAAIIPVETMETVETGGTITYQVTGFIDTEDLLIIKGSTLQWNHLRGGAVVGHHRGKNAPTTISTSLDGAVKIDHDDWIPTWETNNAFSSAYTTLAPPLPASDQWTVSVTKFTGRGTLTVESLPTPANDYQLIVKFTDGGAGAANLTALITLTRLQ